MSNDDQVREMRIEERSSHAVYGLIIVTATGRGDQRQGEEEGERPRGT